MSASRRRKTFVDLCRKAKLPVSRAYVQPGDYTMHSGREAALALLRSGEPPTAIVAANDMMAFGVIEAARELGIRIPNDLSVAGFDDLPSPGEHYPSLTTVRQPVAKMGEMSARHLLAALAKNILPKIQIRLPVSLIVRQSTGPATAGTKGLFQKTRRR
jgi:DNA-binding LacI/PurR family transcriptional regulator